jgi:hypothetical protein
MESLLQRCALIHHIVSATRVVGYEFRSPSSYQPVVYLC